MAVEVTKAFKAVPPGQHSATEIKVGEVVDGRLAEIALQLDSGEETDKPATRPVEQPKASPATPAVDEGAAVTAAAAEKMLQDAQAQSAKAADERQALLDKATAEAEKIVADARAEAEKIIAAVKAETGRDQAARAAAERIKATQAVRDKAAKEAAKGGAKGGGGK